MGHYEQMATQTYFLTLSIFALAVTFAQEAPMAGGMGPNGIPPMGMPQMMGMPQTNPMGMQGPQAQNMMETGAGAGFGGFGGFGYGYNPMMMGGMYNPMMMGGMYNPYMMMGGMMYPPMMQYGMMGAFGPWGMGPFGVGYGYGAYGGKIPGAGASKKGAKK